MMQDMKATVEAMLANGKGLLAADESFPTIEKRFSAIHLKSTEESRRDYREMLFTTAGLSESISGVILFDETLRQKTRSGTPMPALLEKQGIIPGIKVDEGAVSLAGFAGEKITQGLDGLRGRLAEYRKLGARFTKWRAVISIAEHLPSPTCVHANATVLALYAGLSQEAGLVPIVEPEVLMDGDHTIARAEEVMTLVLERVFAALYAHRISFEEMLLKSGMVLSGKDCPRQASDAEVTDATLRCFRRTVPAAVPGIVFLSGGQSERDATKRLNAICQAGRAPWKVSFSYGRALQDSAMATWKGSDDNVPSAQTALSRRARCNGLAAQGQYAEKMETA